MTEGEVVLSSGGLAAAVLEGLKWLIRWLKKDPLFSFPVKFYIVAIPVLSFLCQIPLAYLSVGGYSLPVSWVGWARELVKILLVSLISMATHGLALRGLSAKAQYNAMQTGYAKITVTNVTEEEPLTSEA